MLRNCKPVTIEDVIHFFEVEIDGTGKRDGHPRNPDVPAELRKWQNWKLCELATKEEFENLVLPYGEGVLLKDREPISSLVSWAWHNVMKGVEKLKIGESLDPLIVFEPNIEGPPGGSFRICDGAKRALAYREFFYKNPYRPVKAYVGTDRI